MSAQQHRYGTPATVTQNVARVSTISYHPHLGFVSVLFDVGEEISGSFTVSKTTDVFIQYESLPGPLQAVFDDLEKKSLNYGFNNGVFVSGSVETI